MNRKAMAILFALAAAALYAANIPLSKLLLGHIQPVFLAAFLYFGAGIGISALSAVRGARDGPALTRQELPYIAAMVALDVAAPICLMLGLSRANAANASLLSNFEIVATAVIALLLFRERVSGLMWGAVGLITAASVLLTFDGPDSLRFSSGSLLILVACLCWGLENNCTRKLSSKNAAQIVILKGVFSGLGSLLVALIIGESFPPLGYLPLALLLGFVSYGLSIFLYVKAQKELGAARTSACYSVNPFVGALLSLVILREGLSPTYLAALAVMAAGVALVAADALLVRHSHPHEHRVVGRDGLERVVVHAHPHLHAGGHHHLHLTMK